MPVCMEGEGWAAPSSRVRVPPGSTLEGDLIYGDRDGGEPITDPNAP
jgi:hypothetical protein